MVKKGKYFNMNCNDVPSTSLHFPTQNNLPLCMQIMCPCAVSIRVVLQICLLFYLIFYGINIFIVVPPCYVLCLYVCGLQQYGELNNSCPLCFLFSFA